MKKRVQNIKNQAADEAKKVGFTILGFATGLAISKGMQQISTKYPQMEPFVKYATPILLAGGGFVLSAATEKDEIAAKHIGYGLTTAGVFDGIKLIPVAKDFLSGLDGEIGRSYYVENDKPILELGEFGINALPMKSLDMQSAPTMQIELPELEGTENINGTSDLGYNSSYTDDADTVSGII